MIAAENPLTTRTLRQKGMHRPIRADAEMDLVQEYSQLFHSGEYLGRYASL